MKTYKVRSLPQAEADLTGLYEYIAEASGLAVAGRYIDRIEKACEELSTFPRRGRPRDDLRPGLRVLGFERRAVIAYVVEGDEVLIARVLYGGRNFRALLADIADE